jgi:hypothetical protein
MTRKLWQIVASERFANIVHDATLVCGSIFLIVYFYWLSQRS